MSAGFSITRDDALRAAYASIADRSNSSFEEFKSATDEWDLYPVIVSGELAGAVLMKESELHACIIKAYFGRWLTRKVLRNTLCKILKEFGLAITRTTPNNVIGDAFVCRLGFRKISETDGEAVYILEVENGI